MQISQKHWMSALPCHMQEGVTTALCCRDASRWSEAVSPHTHTASIAGSGARSPERVKGVYRCWCGVMAPQIPCYGETSSPMQGGAEWHVTTSRPGHPPQMASHPGHNGVQCPKCKRTCRTQQALKPPACPITDCTARH